MDTAQPLLNLQINVADIIVVVGATMVLWSRISILETKVDPLWRWWNRRQHPPGPDDELLIDRRNS